MFIFPLPKQAFTIITNNGDLHNASQKAELLSITRNHILQNRTINTIFNNKYGNAHDFLEDVIPDFFFHLFIGTIASLVILALVLQFPSNVEFLNSIIGGSVATIIEVSDNNGNPSLSVVFDSASGIFGIICISIMMSLLSCVLFIYKIPQAILIYKRNLTGSEFLLATEAVNALVTDKVSLADKIKLYKDASYKLEEKLRDEAKREKFIEGIKTHEIVSILNQLYKTIVRQKTDEVPTFDLNSNLYCSIESPFFASPVSYYSRTETFVMRTAKDIADYLLGEKHEPMRHESFEELLINRLKLIKEDYTVIGIDLLKTHQTLLENISDGLTYLKVMYNAMIDNEYQRKNDYDVRLMKERIEIIDKALVKLATKRAKLQLKHKEVSIKSDIGNIKRLHNLLDD